MLSLDTTHRLNQMILEPKSRNRRRIKTTTDAPSLLDLLTYLWTLFRRWL